MLISNPPQLDFACRTFINHIHAPGRELATHRQIQKVWNGALDCLEPAHLQTFLRKTRHGPQQPFGIRMTRAMKDLVDQSFFHDAAGVHHCYAVRGLRHNTEIVGDQQHVGSSAITSLGLHDNAIAIITR